MSAYSGVFAQEIDDLPPPLRARKSPNTQGILSKSGDYGLLVAPPLERRLASFTAFVNRAIRMAKEDRGWSVPDIARNANQAGDKLSNQTIYRWAKGQWDQGVPKPEAVLAFCDALDIPPQAAFTLLWPGKNDATPPPEPAPLDPDIEQLARRLRDPNVSEAEKVTIRATVRHLAGRSATTPTKK